MGTVCGLRPAQRPTGQVLSFSRSAQLPEAPAGFQRPANCVDHGETGRQTKNISVTIVSDPAGPSGLGLCREGTTAVATNPVMRGFLIADAG